MKRFSVARTIAAPPEVVWKILVDAPQYPQWDPGMERIEGRIEPGQKIKVFTKMAPNRAFPALVADFIPAQRMVWSAGMPLGLFKGERTFTLESLEGGGTEFSMEEVFSGLLLPLIGRTIPDLTSAFEQFADGLKGRAEGEAQGVP